MRRLIRPLVVLSLCSACLSAVPEGLDSGSTAGGSSAAGGSGTGTGGSGGSSGSGSTGGGSATAGGSGAAGGMADGGTCGCRAAGICVVGDSPLACGNTGGTCSLCGMGEQCVNGQCVTAACGPGTCSGCCGAPGGMFCATPSTQTNLQCGLNGAMCTRCPMGQQCSNGVCRVPPACDATSCPMGCCFMNQCLSGDFDFSCGTAGAMCMACGTGMACRNGTCVVPPVQDAGPPAPIGSPCGMGMGCGQGQTCLPAVAGFPGGYCTTRCMMGVCPAGSTCVSFGFGQSACFGTCGTCRSGYACQPQADGGSSYCRPDCSAGGAASCTGGTTCSDAGTCL